MKHKEHEKGEHICGVCGKKMSLHKPQSGRKVFASHPHDLGKAIHKLVKKEHKRR